MTRKHPRFEKGNERGTEGKALLPAATLPGTFTQRAGGQAGAVSRGYREELSLES